MFRTTKTQREKRISVIFAIYQFELYNLAIDLEVAFETSSLQAQELKALEWIAAKYPSLVKLNGRYLAAEWTWNRLDPLERAILLYGAFELSFRAKKIVINELVEITKIYTLNDHYQYINAVLDQVGAFYEKTTR